MRRIALALVALVVMAGLLVAPTTPLPTAGAALPKAGWLKVSYSEAMPGEKVKVRGKVPSNGKRRVVLQKRTRTGWKKLAAKQTNRRGKFRFKVRAAWKVGKVKKLRVKAPRSGGYPAVRTPKRKVRTVAQAGSLEAADTTPLSEPFTARASFSPAREGRRVKFQQYIDGSWLTVAIIRQNRRGVAAADIPANEPGDALLRAVATRYRKSRAHRTENLTVNVAEPPEPPAISTMTLPDAILSETYEVTLSTSDHRSGTWAVIDGDLPDGLTLDPSTGTIQGTPTGHAVTHAFTVEFTDTDDLTDTQDLALTTVEPPVIETSAVPDTLIEEPYITTLCTADDRVGTWTIAAGNLPNGLTLDPSTGTIQGTPTGHAATHTFTVEFTDTDNLTDTQDLALTTVTAEPPYTTRVSLSPNGMQTNFYATDSTISSDGRYIAYASAWSELVSDETDGMWGILVWDRDTGSTTRISATADGEQPNGGSFHPSISSDGRYIAFASHASNLVSGDTNGVRDIFVWDRDTDTTTRVSTATDNSQANGASRRPAISADGRYVAYNSVASNLVSGDTNGVGDVFVWDRDTDTTTRVSTATDGTQADSGAYGAAINADGRYITYTSDASNLVPGDTNETWDVFLWDGGTGTTTRVSEATDGTQTDRESSGSAVSADGRHVTYTSFATNLVPDDTNGRRDIFTWERDTGATTRVSEATDGTQANSESFRSAISADGRYITYNSSASNLVSDDTNETWDVFLWDRETGTSSRVSLATTGAEANDESFASAISADGRYISFRSIASNLVGDDTNGTWDMFSWDRGY